MYCWDGKLMHWQFCRSMFVISTVVGVKFLQRVVASDKDEEPIVHHVLYRQEARTDSSEVTFSNKRLV